MYTLLGNSQAASNATYKECKMSEPTPIMTPPTEEKAAKPVAEPKAKKPKAEKKEPTVRRSKFADLYPLDAKITLLAESNPKKVGSKSYTRFEGYTGAADVNAALGNGVTYQDIAYDVGRKFITVS